MLIIVKIILHSKCVLNYVKVYVKHNISHKKYKYMIFHVLLEQLRSLKKYQSIILMMNNMGSLLLVVCELKLKCWITCCITCNTVCLENIARWEGWEIFVESKYSINPGNMKKGLVAIVDGIEDGWRICRLIVIKHKRGFSSAKQGKLEPV